MLDDDSICHQMVVLQVLLCNRNQTYLLVKQTLMLLLEVKCKKTLVSLKFFLNKGRF